MAEYWTRVVMNGEVETAVLEMPEIRTRCKIMATPRKQAPLRLDDVGVQRGDELDARNDSAHKILIVGKE